MSKQKNDALTGIQMPIAFLQTIAQILLNGGKVVLWQ